MTVERRAPVRPVALYLPQFHPDPLNDEAWGPGFTEWHNVARARPVYPGHRQPVLPGELGFYDLRMPEVREQQAAMARSAGIEGFAYYHYWFGDGTRALHRPMDEVLASGRPDFPFCLVWANHDWTSTNWTTLDARRDGLIKRQCYSVDDVEAHFTAVLPALRDERALTVDGLPVFCVAFAADIPREVRFPERFRELAEAAGLPGLHLVSLTTEDPATTGFDASFERPGLLFKSGRRERLRSPTYVVKRVVGWPQRIPYARITAEMGNAPQPSWRAHAPVLTGWDDSPRRGRRGVVVTGYTPEALAEQTEQMIRRLEQRAARDGEAVLFVKSWNEWGEGNRLEPDRRNGRAHLDALGAVLASAADRAARER